jgi:hypothetical protein
LARDTQQAYELRDLEIAREATGVLATVRRTRDLLLVLYPDNPTKLGEFGFECPAPRRPSRRRSSGGA